MVEMAERILTRPFPLKRVIIGPGRKKAVGESHQENFV